jgi:hypothetical protein
MCFVKIWREVHKSNRVMIKRHHGAQEPPPVVKMDMRLNMEVKVKRHLRVCHHPHPSQTVGQDI